MITAEWTIQARAHECAATGKSFTDGESFYALLFDEPAGFRREDLSEEAFKARPDDAAQPFSFWRMKYTPPPPPAPEPLGKQTAEDLLRHYMTDPAPEHASVRFLLAVMLERKRVLKEIETRRGEDGKLMRIYEHPKTGEVFVIPDPELRLDELQAVQTQMAAILGGA